MSAASIFLSLVFLLGSASAAYYEESPQSTQCRQTIVDAMSVPGPGTDYDFPQKCGLLFPRRNIYNKKEVLVGEFTARNCGECAAVCVAQHNGPGFGLASEVLESMSEIEVDRIQQILSAGAKPCTDWVWCDPYEALAGTNECSKKLGPDYDGADYNGTEVEDPFASDNCLGRWRGGELTSYSGYGQDLYLHGTVKGCVTSSGNVIPAGSCQLKNIVSKKYEDHLYGDENDDDVYGSNLMSGMCDWTLDPKH